MTTLARSPQGEIRIAPAALSRLVVRSAESVDSARVRRPRRSLQVMVAGTSCRVSVELVAPFGAQLAELGEAVQERVAHSLREICGLEPDAVDVSVEELED